MLCNFTRTAKRAMHSLTSRQISALQTRCRLRTQNGLRRPCKRSPQQGFSLVELMVVMVIMGMLVGLAAVRYRSYLISCKQYTAKTQIAEMVKAIETFYAQEGRYPTTDEGIDILVEGTASWPDGYLDKLPADPWKNAYEYISPGTSEPYEVISLGADGREGGEGENRDISSESLDSNG